MNRNIVIRKLELKECTFDLLAKFNRYQEVKRCWRKENGEWQLKNISFIENWDNNRKLAEIQAFRNCVNAGGIVICAYVNDSLIGFASILNNLFGNKCNYIRLGMLHVSFEFRNKGIGKKLFEQICYEARNLGATKLYITAHSSEETQAFYKAVGCYETVELNQELYDEEPFDCHLEYKLL